MDWNAMWLMSLALAPVWAVFSRFSLLWASLICVSMLGLAGFWPWLAPIVLAALLVAYLRAARPALASRRWPSWVAGGWMLLWFGVEGLAWWRLGVFPAPLEVVGRSFHTAGRPVEVWTFSGGAPRVAAAPHALAVGGEGEPVSVRWGTDARQMAGSGGLGPIALEGNALFGVADDGTLSEWSREGASQRLGLHRGRVRCLAVGMSVPYGELVASGGEDGEVLVWLAHTPDQALPIARFSSLEGEVESLAFRPDGKVLAAGSSDGMLLVVNVDTLFPVAVVPGHPGGVRWVGFQDHFLLTAGIDGVVRWELPATLPDRSVIQPRAVNAFAPGEVTAGVVMGGARVALGRLDGTIEVWDGESGQRLSSLAGHALPVRRLAFADGRLLSAGEDGTAKLWSLDSEGPLL